MGPGRTTAVHAVEASLRRLQTDHIELDQIHATDAATPLEETLRALDDLIRQGKVRYIGCSNWQAWRIATALGILARLNLARFNTLQAYLVRKIAAVLDLWWVRAELATPLS